MSKYTNDMKTQNQPNVNPNVGTSNANQNQFARSNQRDNVDVPG